jgi:NAD(P)-dependent dehydrogenase (short-subunit alcohol dehydrogenase family)
MSKTIFITSSDSGFGNLIAKALSDEGHGVIAAIEAIDDYSRKTAEELGSIPNIELINIDLNSEKSISDNVDQILRKYGSIDILINCTEVTGMGSLEATSVHQIKRILDIGLFSVIRMIQAVLPSMRKYKCGVILNICCGPSLFSLPFLIPQTLSKMGVIAVSEGLQAELKDEGIDCISVLIDSCLSESVNNKSLNADLPEIFESYKVGSHIVTDKLKQSISECESTKEMCQQVVYDILDVLNMKSGTRPASIIIDKRNEHIIRELLATKIKLQNSWLQQIGIKV